MPNRNGRPPLVMHVFPTFAIGGAQARFTALANRFGPAFRHLVVALDGEKAARERLSPALDVQFPAVTAPKGAMLANAWRFRGLLQQWRPDVMVTCNWGAIEFALANLLPVVRHIHVEDGFGPEERSGQIRRRVLLRRLALRRSTVVLPSRTLERIATGTWHLRHVQYVPNGIDLTRFGVTPVRDGGTVVIGTVAALRPEKNLARLVAAFARVAARPVAVRLVIVGDGPQRGALEAQVAGLGLAGQVTFTGHHEDTPALYAGFDVFALSSDTEQMPLSVLEAMASGLPVAATDVGDVAAMLAAENARFVVPLAAEASTGTAADLLAGTPTATLTGTPADALPRVPAEVLADAPANALAGALAALVDDAALRRRLGAANRIKAERDFDQAVMAQRWRALWDGTALPA